MCLCVFMCGVCLCVYHVCIAILLQSHFAVQVSFSWLFFVGASAILLAFVLVTFLEHYGSWDPIWNITKKTLIILCCNQ